MSEQEEAETTLVSIEPREAEEKIGDGAIAVDVRLDYEWEAGHISGARHIEINDLANVADSFPKDTPLVFYCRSGNRSKMPAEVFRKAGYDAYTVTGGLEAWVESGLPIDPDNGEVAETRPR